MNGFGLAAILLLGFCILQTNCRATKELTPKDVKKSFFNLQKSTVMTAIKVVVNGLHLASNAFLKNYPGIVQNVKNIIYACAEVARRLNNATISAPTYNAKVFNITTNQI